MRKMLFVGLALLGSSSLHASCTHDGCPERDDRVAARPTWGRWLDLRGSYGQQKTKADRTVYLKSLIREDLGAIPKAPLRSEGWIEPKGSLRRSELARARLRLNLERIKLGLTSQLNRLLEQVPPVPRPEGSPHEVVEELADTLIRAVDDFLKTHPGAREALGSRNIVADALGWQNEFNAPWCADWAAGMVSAIHSFPASHPVHRWFRFQWGQTHFRFGRQHNYLVVYPSGRPPTMPSRAGARDLLRFDPWLDLNAAAYFPGEGLGSVVPTNLGIRR